MSETTTTTKPETKPSPDRMMRRTIRRDGDRPLACTCEVIGRGSHGSGGSSGYACDNNRGVKVTIYRRQVGGYIVSRRFWSQWQGEGGRDEATICRTPADVLAALRSGADDEYPGTIRDAEAEALRDAACVDEGIDGIAVEDLDAEAIGGGK